MVTQIIDAEWQFHGVKSVAGQALQWPRADWPGPDAEIGATVAENSVPVPVVNAVCQLALKLLQGDRTAHPAGEGLWCEWSEFTGKRYDVKPRRPLLPPWVQRYLRKYGVPLRRAPGMVKLTRV